MPRTRVAAALLCWILIWFAGCVQRPAAPPPSPEPGPPVVLQPGQPQYPVRIAPVPPAWAVKGSGAYQEGADRLFHGVGMAAAGSGNRILVRTAADNLSRRELGKVLRDYVTELSSGQPEGGEGRLEQLIQESLGKGVIVEHWTDPRDGSMYALCRLGLAQFKETLMRSGAFDTASRMTLLEKADRQHARMAGLP